MVNPLIIASSIQLQQMGFKWKVDPKMPYNGDVSYFISYKGVVFGGDDNVQATELLETVVKDSIQYLKDNNLWTDQLAKQLEL